MLNSNSMLGGMSRRERRGWMIGLMSPPTNKGNLWELQGTANYLSEDGADLNELRETYDYLREGLPRLSPVPDLDTLLAAYCPNPNRDPEEAEGRR